MDIAVLYVYRMTMRSNGTLASEGNKPSICFRGKKHMLCVILDYPIRVIKRPAVDFDKCRPVPVPLTRPEATTYPLEMAVENLTSRVQQYGMTTGARKLLDLASRAAKGEKIADSDFQENAFEDEENLPSTYPPAFNPSGHVASPGAEVSSLATGGEQARRRSRRNGPVTTVVKDGVAQEGEGSDAASTGERRTRKRGAESPMNQAVEYMRAEVAALGGLDQVTKPWRNELFARTAEKFGISPNTCGVQWGKKIVRGGASAPQTSAAASREVSTPASPPARTAVKVKEDAPPPSDAAAKSGRQSASKPVPANKPKEKEPASDTKRRAPIRGEASPMRQAIAYMQDEIRKIGGVEKVTKEWRKELWARTAEKFGISVNTCGVQWNKSVIKGLK